MIVCAGPARHGHKFESVVNETVDVFNSKRAAAGTESGKPASIAIEQNALQQLYNVLYDNRKFVSYKSGNVTVKASEVSQFWKYVWDGYQYIGLSGNDKLYGSEDIKGVRARLGLAEDNKAAGYVRPANDSGWGSIAAWEWSICQKIKRNLADKSGITVVCDKNDKVRGWDEIAKQIKKKAADIVIIVGFNNKGFENTGFWPDSALTYFMYYGDEGKTLAAAMSAEYKTLCSDICGQRFESIVSGDTQKDRRMYALKLEGVAAAAVELELGKASSFSDKYADDSSQQLIAEAVANTVCKSQ